MSGYSRVAQLHTFGQSPWFDYISRSLIVSGRLQSMVDDDGLGGVTSNPAIFEKAVGGGEGYDKLIAAAAHEGLSAGEIFDRIAIEDVRAACDVLAPVYMVSGGEDGFVSIEVTPAAADDTELTISEAHRLFAAVDRPNVMVKIPGTKAGVPAVLQCLKDGLNINITLLFSLAQYEAVADAYLQALEWRLRHDQTVRAVSSVASFFVSRVDTLVDQMLDERIAGAEDAAERLRFDGLKGKAAVANAKVVYERFRTYMNGRAWPLLAASGAKVQRVLWASTGAKNPAYPDLLYVEELIGEHTVTTMPEATWNAFNDHGVPASTIGRHLDESHRLQRELAGAGIDLEQVGARLQRDGIRLFVDAYDGVVRIIEKRRQELLAG